MTEKTRATNQAINAQPGRDPKLLPFTSASNDKNWRGILRIKEIIDKTTNMIFISYKEELLSEPITYILPAAWGRIKDGELSNTQEEIYGIIESMIKDIMERLEIDGLNDTQGFAIGYLIRGLLISKIIYLVEASRNRSKEDPCKGVDNIILPEGIRDSKIF